MTITHLVSLSIQVSMALVMFCIALSASPSDATSLLRRPSLFLRSLLAMNVIMPLFAVGCSLYFKLTPAVEIALVLLALSPLPPIVPNKLLKAGGSTSYVVGLLVVTSLFGIAFVPCALEMLGRLLSRSLQMPVAPVAYVVTTSMLAPIVLGVLVGRFAPGVARRIQKPVSSFASALLLASLLPVLVVTRHAIIGLIGNFTLVAIIVFTLVGFAVGHLLGGPDPDDRSVLALSTATRHPGVAMAIAYVNVPDQKAVPAAVILYLLTGAVVAIPYVNWRKRRHAARTHAVLAAPKSTA